MYKYMILMNITNIPINYEYDLWFFESSSVMKCVPKLIPKQLW